MHTITTSRDSVENNLAVSSVQWENNTIGEEMKKVDEEKKKMLMEICLRILKNMEKSLHELTSPFNPQGSASSQSDSLAFSDFKD